MDNVGEHKKLKGHFNKLDIIIKLFASYYQNQNGVSERLIDIITKKTYIIQITAGIFD